MMKPFGMSIDQNLREPGAVQRRIHALYVQSLLAALALLPQSHIVTLQIIWQAMDVI